MRWIAVVALLGLAWPAVAQTQDAALGRVAEALRYEGQMMYVAGAMRSCNLRDPIWIGRLIQRTRAQSGQVYEAELARLPAGQRSGFEREAWLMQAETRAYTNRLASGTRQTALECAEMRASHRGLAALDGVVAGH